MKDREYSIHQDMSWHSAELQTITYSHDTCAQPVVSKKTICRNSGGALGKQYKCICPRHTKSTSNGYSQPGAFGSRKNKSLFKKIVFDTKMIVSECVRIKSLSFSMKTPLSPLLLPSPRNFSALQGGISTPPPTPFDPPIPRIKTPDISLSHQE